MNAFTILALIAKYLPAQAAAMKPAAPKMAPAKRAVVHRSLAYPAARGPAW